jgi:protein SCO1/2
MTMTDRHTVRSGFAATRAQGNEAGHESPGADASCQPPDGNPTADRFPNALVIDQYGRKRRFYEDLIKNRIVMIQLMSTATEGDLHTVANLTQVQRLLGDRLGRELFLYSVTVDPDTDTPPVLARYAAQHGAHWPFLTGDAADVQAIRDALFVLPGGHAGHPGAQDCSMGLMRYGNDAVGLWGAVPTRTAPEWIAERLGWMQPRPMPQGTPRRRGPQPRYS